VTRTIRGFVHKRTKVRGYEFPFGTRYEFTALIFNQDLVGLKFNIPADYNTRVTVGNRVEIVMENPAMNNGFLVLRESDTVKDLGPALVTEPTKRIKFFAGYITLPWDGYYTIHGPTQFEGTKGKINKVKVPTDLVNDRENMMCCTWVVDGMQIVDRVRVTKIIKIIPKTMTKTWEESMRRVWFSSEGMTIKRMGEVLFIPNEVLPFDCSDGLNHLKKDLLGTVKVTMGYRLWCRWNTHRNAEDRKWKPTAPENIEFSDRSSVRLLQRYEVKK
jgi:hypothetical protein